MRNIPTKAGNGCYSFGETEPFGGLRDTKKKVPTFRKIRQLFEFYPLFRSSYCSVKTWTVDTGTETAPRHSPE